MVIRTQSLFNLYGLKVIYRSVPDTDVFNRINRPVASAKKNIQVLYVFFTAILMGIFKIPVVFYLIRFRLRLDVVHQKLPGRHRRSVRLANKISLMGLHLRKVPAVCRRGFLFLRMRLVNMKKTVNQLPAKDGKNPGNKALPEFSRNTQPATYQRGCGHKPYLQYPAEGPLIAPFKFSRQNNLVSVLRNIAIGDVYERAVDKDQ